MQLCLCLPLFVVLGPFGAVFNFAHLELTSNIRELTEGREGACARARGRYQNVFLSDTEVDELRAELPDLWQQYVEKLSEYMASTGKTYQNHAATIRRWAAEDRRKGKCIPDYTYKEGESL